MLEGAFERTRQYTKDRQVFGKPLVKLQVKLFKLKMIKFFSSDYSTPFGRGEN